MEAKKRMILQMNDGAYVSVIAWPELMTTEDRIKLVERAVGLGPFLAEQAVRRRVPSIICRMAIPEATRALTVLQRAGAVVFGPKQSAFQKRANVHAAKRLISGSGTSYFAEAWRGEPLAFDAVDIAVLVRASLRATETKSLEQGGSGFMSLAVNPYGSNVGVVAADLAGDFETISSARPTRLNLTKIVDLHLVDGTRIRLNGDKFSFDVLGDKRGYTDKQNMDKLAVLLSEQAPNAVVDLNFRSFRVPPDLHAAINRTHGSGRVRQTVEAPGFDFYSVWAALMYRHLASS